jgi:CRISPR/Cas system endoribonuclease Cas6 (RAMP superfamily)
MRQVIAIPAAFRRVNVEWQDWTRYSSRQRTRMQMGGIVGSAELDTAGMDSEGWAGLWLGQWLHIGKQTSMGLGHYRLSQPV